MERKCLKRQWTPPVRWESRRSWPTTCQRDCGSSRHPPKGCWTRCLQGPSRSAQILTSAIRWDQVRILTLTICVTMYLLLHSKLTAYLMTSQAHVYDFTVSADQRTGHGSTVCYAYSLMKWQSRCQPGPGSHLEARLKKTPLPHLNGWWQHSVLQPCICRPESFEAFCRHSAPTGHLHFLAKWAFPTCPLTGTVYIMQKSQLWHPLTFAVFHWLEASQVLSTKVWALGGRDHAGPPQCLTVTLASQHTPGSPP